MGNHNLKQNKFRAIFQLLEKDATFGSEII